MEDHGAIGELDKRLGESEGLVAVRVLISVCSFSSQPVFDPVNLEKGGRTRGRSRVPKPPTRMSAVDSNQLSE